MVPFVQDLGQLDGFMYSWRPGSQRRYWPCPGLQSLGQGWTSVSELEAVTSNAGDYPALSFCFSMENVFC